MVPKDHQASLLMPGKPAVMTINVKYYAAVGVMFYESL